VVAAKDWEPAVIALTALWFVVLNTPLVDHLPKFLRIALSAGGGMAAAQQASLAVLPLRNVSNDTSQEYYSDGLTQDLTSDLGQVDNLFVISSNSAFAYKGSSAKPAAIARDLGVVYVLSGTVKKQEGRVSVTAQLLDARTGKQVWGQNFDQNGQDVFSIQDNIIKAVTQNLHVEPEKRPVRLAAADATQNATAYDHYLKGRQLFYNYTREDVAAARQEFTSAVGLNPGFARAYGWLGYTHLEDIQEGWTDDVKKSGAAALDWAQKGAELDSADYYTHWNLAAVLAGLKDMERARTEYEAALALNGNDADLLADMADMLSYSGEPLRAIEQIERAKQFNPKYPDWYDWSLGFAYFQNRQYAEALASLEKMSDPPNNAYVLLAACKAKLGKPVTPGEVIARVKAKDATWTPDHLARFPFVKAEDQQHYLESFKAIGIDVPLETKANEGAQ
jgi:adenylate cyclase